MYVVRSVVVIALISFFSSACVGPRDYARFMAKENKSKPMSFKEVKISSSKTEVYRAAHDISFDILHMDLSVSFNWGKQECIGAASILVKPYYYNLKTIELDAKDMTFNGISIFDSNNQEIRYEVVYDKKVLKLNLEREVSADERLTIKINYIAYPNQNAGSGSVAIKDNKGLYFINTDNQEPNQPIQLWTQGETESNSKWFPTVDKPNEKFTSTVSISVNKDLTVLSNGTLLKETEEGNLKTYVWNNDKPMSAYLIMMAIGDFKITRDDLNTMEVSYYLEPKYHPYAKSIFENTKEMIDFYSNKLGVDYPWQKYAQVVVRDFVSGAMENTSATIHGEFVQKNARELVDDSNEDIIGHELFHQWFGDLVTCESWSQLVLNEGFAAYGEQLWDEYHHGVDMGLKTSIDKNNRYLKYAETNEDAPIVNYAYKDKEDMFNVITYQKGARVINLLRSELGDDAFFKALKNYLTRYSYKSAEVEDLRREFEEICGRDLKPFFNQWFYKGGHPEIEVRYNYIDSLKRMEVSVEQIQKEGKLFKFPLMFKVSQDDEKDYHKFNIERRKEVFTIPYKNEESSAMRPIVFVDPYATFVGKIIDNQSIAGLLYTLKNATNYVEKYRSIEELGKAQSQSEEVRAWLRNAMLDKNKYIRLKVLQTIDWKNQAELNLNKSTLLALAQHDEYSYVRAKAIEILGNTQDKTIINDYVAAASDSSYKVAGEALLAIQKVAPEEAQRLATQLESDAKANLFNKIGFVYAVSKNPTYDYFFTQNIQKVFKNERAELVNQYSNFLTNINLDSCYKKGIPLLSNLAVSDKYQSVRYAAIRAVNAIKQQYMTVFNTAKDNQVKQLMKSEADKIDTVLNEIINQRPAEFTPETLRTLGIITQ